MDYLKLNGQLLQLNGKFLVIPPPVPPPLISYDVFAGTSSTGFVLKSIDSGVSFINEGHKSGASDWFLPSEDELNTMYTNLHLYGVGGFRDYEYWSSTEFDAWSGRCQNFSTGNIYSFTKDDGLDIRFARTFTDSIGVYSLRDVGPSGGWIFYIDGTTYYECYPVERMGGVWSNVFDELIGTTSALIGEGLNNTNEIVGQVGHTWSAAQEALVTITDYGIPTCFYQVSNGDIFYGTSTGWIVNHTKEYASLYYTESIEGITQTQNGNMYFSISWDICVSYNLGLSWDSIYD